MFFVTPKHIEEANLRTSSYSGSTRVHNNLHNPVAIALQERCKYAVVTPTKAHMITPGYATVHLLGPWAQAWLRDFADGKPVGPLQITL